METPPPKRQSIEQTYPAANLDQNQVPLGAYFGEFLGLLRGAVDNAGSEFGLGISLFSLAISIRAANIIEVGRFKGFSTLALAGALKFLDVGWQEPAQHRQRPDINYPQFESPRLRKLFSIDPYPTAEAASLIASAGLGNYVQCLDLRSDQVSLAGEADMIFIDGDHSYEGCRGDVLRLIPNHLRPGGYFVLHDYFGWYPPDQRNKSPIKLVVDEIIAQNPALQRLLIDTGYQSFVIFRKPNPVVDR